VNHKPSNRPPGFLRRKAHTLGLVWTSGGLEGLSKVLWAKLRAAAEGCRRAMFSEPMAMLPPLSLEFREVPPSDTLISVVVPVYDPPAQILESCLASVLHQTHRAWQLCICDDGSTRSEVREILAKYQDLDPRVTVVRSEGGLGIARASNMAAGSATGVFIALLDHDDELHPQALTEIAHAIDLDPTIDVLYTDEDKLERWGTHCDPFFKPDWSPDYLHSTMYLLHCLCVRTSLFRGLGGLRSEYDGSQDYDLALRATSVARRVHHIPRILYHWRKTPGSAAASQGAKPYALDAGLRALADAAASALPPATADLGAMPGTYRLRRGKGERPPVTLAIITSDPVSAVKGRGNIRILSNFLHSIEQKSTYPDYRVLVVNDGFLSADSAAIIERCGGRCVSYARTEGEGFNFSRKVNFAVSNIETEHFVLLNDDLEVISPDWIEALMDYAVEPGVAGVGGRLLFTNGRIQHAGVVIRATCPDHVFYNVPSDKPGYYGYTHVVRNYAAVTAAVLASTLTAFRAVGPFDETLAHDFNDVDFCLRAWTRGYRIVYTPFCELYHFEHVSLVRTEPDPAELRLFQERWPTWLESDPFFRRA
jgi:GT2 family glycosyltransferase